MTVQGDVVLIGLRDTKKALKDYAPDVLKQMNAEIRGVGKSLTLVAKADIPEAPPMRGWRQVPASAGRTRGSAGWPAWDPAAIRKGIKFKTGGRRTKGSAISDAYSLVNDSAAGAIFEVAGRRSNGSGTGVDFINNLNKVRQASRAIWAALDDRGKREIQDAIVQAIDKAERELQARLAAANDREVAA